VYANPTDLLNLAEEIDTWEHHLEDYEPPEDAFDYELEYYSIEPHEPSHIDGISAIEDKPYDVPYISLAGADFCGIAGHELKTDLRKYKSPFSLTPAHPACRSKPKRGFSFEAEIDHATDALRLAGLAASAAGVGALEHFSKPVDLMGGARGGGKSAKMAEAYLKSIADVRKDYDKAIMDTFKGLGDVAVHTSDALKKGEALIVDDGGIVLSRLDFGEISERIADDTHKKVMGVVPKETGGLKKIIEKSKPTFTGKFVSTNPGSPTIDMGAMSVDVAKDAGKHLAMSIDKSIAKTLMGSMKKMGEWK
jgi:hypothetical protein